MFLLPVVSSFICNGTLDLSQQIAVVQSLLGSVLTLDCASVSGIAISLNTSVGSVIVGSDVSGPTVTVTPIGSSPIVIPIPTVTIPPIGVQTEAATEVSVLPEETTEACPDIDALETQVAALETQVEQLLNETGVVVNETVPTNTSDPSDPSDPSVPTVLL